MENPFPTFNDFSRFNDYYRLKCCRKPRNKKWLKVIYYPFALIGIGLLWLSLIIFTLTLISASRKSRQYSYRNSNNYRKVIKEGLFFNTIEYHEK